jgi:hypothetical protein
MSINQFIIERARSLFSNDPSILICKLDDLTYPEPPILSLNQQTSLDLLYACCEAKDKTDLGDIILRLPRNTEILIETAIVLTKKSVRDRGVFQRLLAKRFPNARLVLPKNV